MSYLSLARKYRPRKLGDVYGQDHVTRTLTRAIALNRVSSGYIFAGHRGIGKTSVARILAMALNCHNRTAEEPCGTCPSCTEIQAGGSSDVIEIDAATNRGIDEIRELRAGTQYRPTRDHYKVYILDEAHQVTSAAFNALLKTLEEPPANTVFVLATTQVEDIPLTIRSRCQVFRFHASSLMDITTVLTDVSEKEKIAVEPLAMDLIAEAGDGSIRDALSFLDQLLACCGSTITQEDVVKFTGSIGPDMFEKLMGHVAQASRREALLLVNRFWYTGHQPGWTAQELAKYIHTCLMAKVLGPEGLGKLFQIPENKNQFARRTAALFSDYGLSKFLEIILGAKGPLASNLEQRFHFELAILEMIHFRKERPSCMEPTS